MLQGDSRDHGRLSSLGKWALQVIFGLSVSIAEHLTPLAGLASAFSLPFSLGLRFDRACVSRRACVG